MSGEVVSRQPQPSPMVQAAARTGLHTRALEQVDALEKQLEALMGKVMTVLSRRAEPSESEAKDDVVEIGKALELFHDQCDAVYSELVDMYAAVNMELLRRDGSDMPAKIVRHAQLDDNASHTTRRNAHPQDIPAVMAAVQARIDTASALRAASDDLLAAIAPPSDQ
ncbi:uncharacterized protein AMSG_02959 [Thecamonas trahens ATCC 50062]|uniref:Uncharacterized protein n=1 Tax=Thecamonas trahens ATCC 50062 TaxID=461836 RepID=A0A0L0D5D0_THETB|nr:hypothetical protein AMSG_02959 [Thecamonas trahens ATCC 50062]KNC46523.1 hypothetical protein AMSG_02959 [Thecamonas trahens ATCC 50062]|eukprot:XP_013760304.1 hypothetical protein AMSG_02959 [Thecamonas trahens ATCC 50062]